MIKPVKFSVSDSWHVFELLLSSSKNGSHVWLACYSSWMSYFFNWLLAILKSSKTEWMAPYFYFFGNSIWNDFSCSLHEVQCRQLAYAIHGRKLRRFTELRTCEWVMVFFSSSFFFLLGLAHSVCDRSHSWLYCRAWGFNSDAYHEWRKIPTTINHSLSGSNRDLVCAAIVPLR